MSVTNSVRFDPSPRIPLVRSGTSVGLPAGLESVESCQIASDLMTAKLSAHSSAPCEFNCTSKISWSLRYLQRASMANCACFHSWWISKHRFSASGMLIAWTKSKDPGEAKTTTPKDPMHFSRSFLNATQSVMLGLEGPANINAPPRPTPYNRKNEHKAVLRFSASVFRSDHSSRAIA